jgi:Uma2 family endonuclease
VAADAYLRHLREHHPEHFMESVEQAQQRKIFVESMDLVTAANPEVHAYNELLVQWRQKETNEICQVVPDNMVVLAATPPKVQGSFNVPLQPDPPFWVLEYVSKESMRKDYEESYDKYEKELKVPYYLTFYPDDQELTLYRHNGRRYVSVKPNKEQRYEVANIRVELALVDRWVRFWHNGRLLPLPAELQAEIDALTRQVDDERRRADDERRRADLLAKQNAALLAELEKLRAKKGG